MFTSSRTSAMDIFAKIFNPLTVNLISKKKSSEMFDWLLNTPLFSLLLSKLVTPESR